MQIVIEIPEAPMEDYRDLLCKIRGMAASEGLFDDKKKSQKALALKVVLDILDGVINGTPLPKGHGRLIDADRLVRVDHIILESTVDNAPPIIEADKEAEGDEHEEI